MGKPLISCRTKSDFDIFCVYVVDSDSVKSVAVQQLSAVLIPYSCLPSIFRNSACLLCTPCDCQSFEIHMTHTRFFDAPLTCFFRRCCGKLSIAVLKTVYLLQKNKWPDEFMSMIIGYNKHVKPALCSFKILKSRGTQSMCLIIIIIIKQVETVTFWTCSRVCFKRWWFIIGRNSFSPIFHVANSNHAYQVALYNVIL